MSRTFRRKNYELVNASSWDRRGRKIGGFYAQRDEEYDWMSERYRAPTEKELKQNYWYNHSESKTGNSRSPSKWWKNQDSRKLRRFNEQELFRWAFKVDYEPIFRLKIFEDFWWFWD